jgi:hypothetical protein
MTSQRARTRRSGSATHEVVRLDDLLDIIAVDADGNTHEQVLRSLGDLAIDAEQVGPLEGLEAKVVLRGSAGHTAVSETKRT